MENLPDESFDQHTSGFSQWRSQFMVNQKIMVMFRSCLFVLAIVVRFFEESGWFQEIWSAACLMVLSSVRLQHLGSRVIWEFPEFPKMLAVNKNGWLMMVDEGWWCLMMVDDGWWWLMMDIPLKFGWFGINYPPFWETSICRDHGHRPSNGVKHVETLPGPRLVPMAHRHHPQLGRDCGPITAPDSLHLGKVWEKPMKHINIG